MVSTRHRLGRSDLRDAATALRRDPDAIRARPRDRRRAACWAASIAPRRSPLASSADANTKRIEPITGVYKRESGLSRNDCRAATAATLSPSAWLTKPALIAHSSSRWAKSASQPSKSSSRMRAGVMPPASAHSTMSVTNQGIEAPLGGSLDAEHVLEASLDQRGISAQHAGDDLHPLRTW